MDYKVCYYSIMVFREASSDLFLFLIYVLSGKQPLPLLKACVPVYVRYTGFIYATGYVLAHKTLTLNTI